MAENILHICGFGPGPFNDVDDTAYHRQLLQQLVGSLRGGNAYTNSTLIPQDRFGGGTVPGVGRYGIRIFQGGTYVGGPTAGSFIPASSSGVVCHGWYGQAVGASLDAVSFLDFTYKEGRDHTCWTFGAQDDGATSLVYIYKHNQAGATHTYTLKGTYEMPDRNAHRFQAVLDTTGGTPRCRLFVDGTVQITATDAAVDTWETQLTIFAQNQGKGSELEYHMSAYYVSELTGGSAARTAGWNIVGLAPNADLDAASVDEWTSSTGGENKYRQVDDFNDNKGGGSDPTDNDPDTDYITSPTSGGKRQMFAFQPITALVVPIYVTYWHAEQNVGGAAQCLVRLCDGTTVSETAATVHADSFSCTRLPLNLAGAGWTEALINTMQGGPTTHVDNISAVRVPVVCLEVMGTTSLARPVANVESNNADEVAHCAVSAAGIPNKQCLVNQAVNRSNTY